MVCDFYVGALYKQYKMTDPNEEQENVFYLAACYTQRRVQPDQCYFTVQITGINFECSL